MPRKVEKVGKPNFLGDESSSLGNGAADDSVDHVSPSQPTNEKRRSQRNRSLNQQDATTASETSQRDMSQSLKSTPKKAGANASLNRQKSGTSKRKQTSPKKNMTATTSKKNTTSKQNTTSKRRIPQGLRILKDVMRLQKDTSLLIPKLAFSRVIREVLLEFKNDLRITAEALNALQESSETYLTHLLSDAYKCTMHRRAVTLHVRDIRIVRYLRGPNDPGNH